METGRARLLRRLAGLAAAVLGPAALTAVLTPLPGAEQRDYVYLYLGLVATMGLLSGLGAALICAAISFLLVDYFFVVPFHTLTIGDTSDVVNLMVFFAMALAVGGLGSRRRHTQLEAERLTSEILAANTELERLRREQNETAAVAVRLARAEQHVQLLEASDRARSELLANVSHELRTPLGSILTGATDLLESRRLPVEVRAELEALVSEARRLGRLVADLLDMARIEGHVLTLNATEIDLGEAIEAATARLHLTAPAREVEVKLPPSGLEVLADWDRLGQILDNLLQNADRHAPSETPITVEAVPGRRSMVVTRVIDRGPGVAEQDRERIFERFVRGGDGQGDADRGSSPAGTGLGLAIVRGLVEAHAGRVWIEDSEPGQGGRFAFTLPAA
ncbi:MAG: ATP-binding protein [Candidatus Dormiibacterota bacterium]